jgi:predicted NBD/HSP70 family sugar kinase
LADPTVTAASAAMREQNVSAVLRIILADEPIARIDVADRTGLSQGSLTRLTEELRSRRLCTEVPGQGPTPRIGRPRVPLVIDRSYHVALGMHIGLRRTTLGLLDLSGKVLASENLEHDSLAPQAVVEQAVEALPRFLRTHAGGRRPLGLGATTAGWVRPESGVVVDHEVLGWREVPLRDLLVSRTRRLKLPVWLDNTYRAMAMAELWFGTAKDVRSVVLLFVGNVVGAAIAVHRVVQIGARSGAGNIGHLHLPGNDVPCTCGRRGCLQAALTDATVLQQAYDRFGHPADGSFDGLVAQARAGHAGADGLLRERANHVGVAVGMLIDLVDPDLVVLAGSGITAAPEYQRLIRESSARHAQGATDTEAVVRATSFGDDALTIAPGALVLDAVYSRPLTLVQPVAALQGSARR